MSGWAPYYDQPFQSYGIFSRINRADCLDKIDRQIQEDFQKFLVTKQEFLANNKYQKYIFEYHNYNVYVTKARKQKSFTNH